MLVSASFLSSDNIPQTLKVLNETDVDFIHVDVMDGKFVKQKTMPFKEMRHIYKFTSKRLDVHLMVEKPQKFIENYASLNTEYLTIHSELEDEVVLKSLQLIKSYAIKAGLCLKTETPVAEIVPYLPYLDLILVMAVEPGAGGQSFRDSAIAKIGEVKALLKSYPQFSIKVSVDGGITKESINKVKEQVDMVVSGSYIVNSHHMQEAINNLRY